MFRTVEFDSTFANEWVFDEHKSPVRPGSRALAEEIADRLRPLVSAVGPIHQHSYYGWTFDAELCGCSFNNVLNPADRTSYFTIELRWYWLRFLLIQRPRHAVDAYCDTLARALSEIPQITAIRWHDPQS
jgi:hypothetical protein